MITISRRGKWLALISLLALFLVVTVGPVLLNAFVINASGLAAYTALVRPQAVGEDFFQAVASRLEGGADECEGDWYRHWALGRMYLVTEDNAAAVRELECAVEVAPGNDGWLSVDLLNAYDRVGASDRFIAHYEEARRFIGMLAQPCRNGEDDGCRALAVLGRGGYDPADPASVDRVALHYFYEARRLWQAGSDQARALALLQKAQEIRPHDLHVVYLEARIHEALGEDAEAEAALEKLRFFRIQPWLDARLGSLLVETALELVENGVWSRPQALDYASVLVWQHPREASTEQFLRAVLRRYPDDADVWLLLGEWRRRRGEFEAARDVYRHVLELWPDHPAAFLALRQMESAGPPVAWGDRQRIAAFLEVPPEALDVGPNLLDAESAGVQSPVDIYLGWAPRGTWRADIREYARQSGYAPASFIVGFDELGFRGRAIRLQGFWTQDLGSGLAPWAGMWTNDVKLKPRTLYVLSFAYKATGVGNVRFSANQHQPAVLREALTLRPTDGKWREVVVIGANWSDQPVGFIPVFRTFTRGQVLFDDIELRELIPHRPLDIPPKPIIRTRDWPE